MERARCWQKHTCVFLCVLIYIAAWKCSLTLVKFQQEQIAKRINVCIWKARQTPFPNGWYQFVWTHSSAPLWLHRMCFISTWGNLMKRARCWQKQTFPVYLIMLTKTNLCFSCLSMLTKSNMRFVWTHSSAPLWPHRMCYISTWVNLMKRAKCWQKQTCAFSCLLIYVDKNIKPVLFHVYLIMLQLEMVHCPLVKTKCDQIARCLASAFE